MHWNLSKEQLLSAIHFSPIPTAIGGSDGSIITFNKALQELIGYKRSEIKDVAEWAETLYPDETYRRFVWKNIQQALDGKKQDCTEFTITRKDGSAKVVDFKTSFFQGGLMIQMMDITERRRIQALVQKKVDEQRLLLDTIDTQIWYLTDVETYGRVNRAHVEFLGLQFQDVAYKRLDEFLPPDVVEVCREGNVEIFETRQPIRTEEWIPNARGEKRLIRITKTPKLNQTGEVEYVVCAGTDITDLRASEERFRMIAESTGSMIGVMDATGTYEYVNPAHRILGYEPEELMGASAFSLIHPDDAERLANILQKGLSGEASRISTQYRAIGKNGKTFFHEGAFDSIRNSNGELEKIVFVCDDVTEKQEMTDALVHEREMLSMVIEGTRAGTWEWYVQTGEAVFNDRWAEMLGYTLAELQPVSIRTWMDLCHPKDLEEARRLLEDHFAGKHPYYECELRMRHKEGHWVWMEDKGKVVKWTDEGAPLLMTGTHVDVTERKRAEAERLALERRLHQVEKAESLSRMAGAVAHHFNNLLGAVMGNLELAQMDLTQGKAVAGRLKEADKATRRAADMSRLMLTFLGQTPSSPMRMDLSKTCLDRLAELQGEIPDRVMVETDLPVPGPVVKADPGQAGQALAILVANAWEAMDEDGGGRIQVSVSTENRRRIRGDRRFPIDWQPATDRYACLTVSDNGRGMPSEMIHRIFDPFYTDKFTGRGLGLAVALGIVKSFGGCMTVESKPGKGSTFHVFIPLTTESVVQPKPEKPADKKKIPEGGVILLVEDQQMVRDAAEAMLKYFGFEVLTARDGMEALTIFRERQGDIRLVLTDLSMPRMNGWETLKALRKIRPDIPVILSSGYDEARAMAGDHAEKPEAFLSKPYQMAGLKAAVEKALETRIGFT